MANDITVRRAEFKDIEPFRELYRQEMDCQIRFRTRSSRAGWPTPTCFCSTGGSPVTGASETNTTRAG